MPESSQPRAAPDALAAVPAADPSTLYVFTNGLFAVHRVKKIPAVCLKCAATTDVERRETRLAIGTGGAGLGIGGGVAGAAIANSLRHAGELFVPMIVGLVVLIGA